MTKEEVIKAAYGEHWQNVKAFVDENGWCKWDYSNNSSPSRFGLKEAQYEIADIKKGQHYIWRPISLSGIENNNGWISGIVKTPKQTAVQWLVNQIQTKHDKSFIEFYGAEIQQAEQMFEEQIKEAHKAGIEFMASTKINDAEYSEKYFEKTFKK
jgi:hypothetical protein